MSYTAFLASRKINNLRVFNTPEYSNSPRLHNLLLCVFVGYFTVFGSGRIRLYRFCIGRRCELGRKCLLDRDFQGFLPPLDPARDYFNELKAANTFSHYKDEYVCFRDDDVPTFMVVAKGSDVIEMKKKAGDLAGSRQLADSKDLLFLQSYYKGVASEEFIYEPAKKDVADDNREYSIEFKSPFPDKMVYTINWATGRYLQRVYMYQKSRTIPSKEGSGKCELIHPKQHSDIAVEERLIQPRRGLGLVVQCAPMLPRIQPMRLTRIAQPFDDSDYLFELKHDGFRATVYKQPLSQAWPLLRVWN